MFAVWVVCCNCLIAWGLLVRFLLFFDCLFCLGFAWLVLCCGFNWFECALFSFVLVCLFDACGLLFAVLICYFAFCLVWCFVLGLELFVLLDCFCACWYWLLFELRVVCMFWMLLLYACRLWVWFDLCLFWFCFICFLWFKFVGIVWSLIFVCCFRWFAYYFEFLKLLYDVVMKVVLELNGFYLWLIACGFL